MLSPSPSPSASSPRHSSPKPNLSSLPPLVTNHPHKRSALQRPSSYAQNRMSSYSTTSTGSHRPSRPPSHMFPSVHSSLSYTLVRDFAYPVSTSLHYGPPPESSAAASGASTPAVESSRTPHLPHASWNSNPSDWQGSGWGAGEHLPQMAYGGSQDDHGPPYSEDEDLQSPIVVSSRQKKWLGDSEKEESGEYDQDRGYFAGVNGDGSETYYVSEADEMADGPGGELVTYPPDQARHSSSVLYPNAYSVHGRGEDENSHNQPSSGLGPASNDESRYSRDYQFTIASPDEEMHGKAVALFDFARENVNELPLVEGQVIWVSYRHGQGWLVAEDPKTRESGLVPEAYVRLLRDIEGGLTSLSSGGDSNKSNSNNNKNNKINKGASSTVHGSIDPLSPDPRDPISNSNNSDPTTISSIATTSTSSDSAVQAGHRTTSSTGSNGEKSAAVVTKFSTSSKDLDPYHTPLLGTQTGQSPPQVVHYHGSQVSTPTTQSPVSTRKEVAGVAGGGGGGGSGGGEGAKQVAKRTQSKQKKGRR